MTFHCATCWDDLPDDWPGGICHTLAAKGRQ